jgi:predicted CopG family antitoxin
MMSTKKKPGNILVKGLSIDEDLYNRALAKAHAESRSFSYVVRRAIERDLTSPEVLDAALVIERSHPESDTISTEQVAEMLNLSVSMIRKRQRNPKDPLRRARSRLGKKKPMQFSLSKILQLQRELG